MTRDELVETLKGLEVRKPYDPETSHIEADEALLAYIDDPEVTRAFNEIDKWYA